MCDHQASLGDKCSDCYTGRNDLAKSRRLAISGCRSRARQLPNGSGSFAQDRSTGRFGPHAQRIGPFYRAVFHWIEGLERFDNEIVFECNRSVVLFLRAGFSRRVDLPATLIDVFIVMCFTTIIDLVYGRRI